MSASEPAMDPGPSAATKNGVAKAAAHAPAEQKLGHHVPEDFPAPIRALAKISRGLAVIEGVCIGFALFSLIALAIWQFITRNLRMHGYPSVPAAPEWTDNVLRHSVFLIGYLGAMFATYTARHLRVDAVTRLAGVKIRLILRLVAGAGAMTVCTAIIYAAWNYRIGVIDEIAQEGQIFTAARGAMIIVVGTAGMMFHFFTQFVLDATYVLTGLEVPAWWIAEASHGGEAAVDDTISSTVETPDAAP